MQVEFIYLFVRLTLSHSYIDIVFKLLYLRITDLLKYYIDGKKYQPPKWTAIVITLIIIPSVNN